MQGHAVRGHKNAPLVQPFYAATDTIVIIRHNTTFVMAVSINSVMVWLL